MITFSGISNATEKFRGQIFLKAARKDERDEIVEAIEKARSELERAESLFNEVTDADISDYAIYNILAIRSRYSYLVKLAKEKGIHA